MDGRRHFGRAEETRRSEGIVGFSFRTRLSQHNRRRALDSHHTHDNDVVGSSHDIRGRASEMKIYDTPVSWILSHQSCGGVGKGAKGGKNAVGPGKEAHEKERRDGNGAFSGGMTLQWRSNSEVSPRVPLQRRNEAPAGPSPQQSALRVWEAEFGRRYGPIP